MVISAIRHFDLLGPKCIARIWSACWALVRKYTSVPLWPASDTILTREPPTTIAVAQALDVTILADTNRDGKIDAQTDGQNKASWTNERGAIFLPNIGDTDGRCSANIDINTADTKIDTCNDASDNILRNASYLAPLKVLPVAGLAKDATGSLTATNAAKVRLFRKTNKGWSYVDSSTTFTASDLAAGLDLGIDARDIRRPGGWDGRTSVQVSVTSGGKEYKDAVALRVSPVLTHHHGQSVEYVIMRSTEQEDGYDKYWTQTVDGVANATSWAGIKGGLKQAFSGDDRWSQDFIEPGYVSMPGPNGLVYLHVIIRSFQDYRVAGRQAFTALRSANTGAVQWLVPGYSQDSGGNIETIPPYSYNGKHYPAGRVISGRQETALPNAFAFFKAQETQEALELDTSWLLVGHVDEFIQFLPTTTSRGWAIMVDDPKAGLEFFKNLKQQGHGNLNWLSRKFNTAYPKGYPKTINDLLALPQLEDYTKLASDKIEANLNILKKETGITDAEIYRLPGIYYLGLEDTSPSDNAFAKAQASDASDGGGDVEVEDWQQSAEPVSRVPALSALQAGGGRAVDSLHNRAEQVSLISIGPAVINGIVLSDKHYASPNPFGPVVNGVDLLQKNAIDTYKKLNYDVRFVDDWNTLHILDGEIHCGSNTVRTPKGSWWA